MNAKRISSDEFEIMGHWQDAQTRELQFWLRFFPTTDAQGRREGDGFSRIFTALDLFTFLCFRGEMAIEPRELTPEQDVRIAEILRARMTLQPEQKKKRSFFRVTQGAVGPIESFIAPIPSTEKKEH